MTPKEKATELYLEFSIPAKSYIEGKKCALLCVSKIIDNGNLEFMTIQESLKPRLYEYWVEVRKEIEKL
jgi:hypothetical protein